MRYRENPKNGDQISQLGFGCLRLPHKGRSIDLPRTAEMVHAAIEGGVNYFDTAYIYQGSEAALGEILSGGARARVKLATKLPTFLTRSPSDFDRFFDAQCARLRTDYIDYYLMHMLTDIGAFERLRALGLEAWIEAGKRCGRIRNIGFSFHGALPSFRALVDAYPWDFCMIQYNYLDEHHQAGTAGLTYAHERGLPVIVMEPLRGGRLAGGLPKAATCAFRALEPTRSDAEWGLRWVWDHPEVLTVLSGMSTGDQAAENIKVASDARPHGMSEPERAACRSAAAVLHEGLRVLCTGCGYCMPCPAGVDIPHCFAWYNDSAFVGRSRAIPRYLIAAGVLPKTPSYASLCRRCGRCEAHCPQNIPIAAQLARVARALEPFWVKPAAGLVRRFFLPPEPL
ncbi:MAG: aldo/keto reductase [Oscillospiraceae bacterium]|jgi:predicted aldo/keto reductase-like oxidoreductase|nr:aldo/keto reductase [Oscillospiraceae bacterium]